MQPTPDEAVDGLIQLRDVAPAVFVLFVGALLVAGAAVGYVRLRRTMRQDDLVLFERALRIWKEFRGLDE